MPATWGGLLLALSAGLVIQAAQGKITREHQYRCSEKNVTFECQAVERVPTNKYSGTAFKIWQETVAYCPRNSICMTTNKTNFQGKVTVQQINYTTMTFQILEPNLALEISCDVDTRPGYHHQQVHITEVTSVECIPSCIGQDAIITCKRFKEFRMKGYRGAFLRIKGTTDDLFHCGEDGNCSCMNECGPYKGRFEFGSATVRLKNVTKEDSKVLTYFFEKEMAVKPENCSLMMDPKICPELPTATSPTEGKVVPAVSDPHKQDDKQSTVTERPETTGKTGTAGKTSFASMVTIATPLVILSAVFLVAGTCF